MLLRHRSIGPRSSVVVRYGGRYLGLAPPPSGLAPTKRRRLAVFRQAGRPFTVCSDDYGTLTDQALRRSDGCGQPDLRGPARCGHRFPGAERVGQVDDDAHDHGPRLPRLGVGPDRRQALFRVGLAPPGGRRPARREGVPPGPDRPQPPALAGPHQRHPAAPGRRGPGPGGPELRRQPAGREVLARHEPAARHRRDPAGRPGCVAVRRAGQRSRPRGHPLGPATSSGAWPRRAGPCSCPAT